MPPMPDIARTGSWTSKYLSHIVHLPRCVCGCEKKKGEGKRRVINQYHKDTMLC